MRVMMSTLKEYRFRKDPERGLRDEPDLGLDAVEEVARPGSGGVASAIERAREASSHRGRGGAHVKLKDADGEVSDAVLKFGRHKGKRVSVIATEDPLYLDFIKAREYDAERRPDGFPKDLCEIVRRFR